MKRAGNAIARAAMGCVIALSANAALADALTDRAKAMLARHEARAAYELLLPAEATRAGDPEFDYLLGIAAIDAGEAERAVFALERVLAVQPRNHVARAEIARAYLALGEREAARREFQIVREQSIPADAKANIDRFLAAIAAAETTRFSGFIELGTGYDSNVNAATSTAQIALPALGGIIVTLDPSSTERGDAFALLSGGVNLTHKLSEAWSVVGNAAGSARGHDDEKRFDQTLLEGSLGARWARGRNAITAGGQLQNFELDYESYRRTRGLVAQWQHSYDERRQASLFGQFSELRYPTQEIRDADRAVVGIAYGKAFTVTYTPVVFASAYAGREKELAEGVPHLGHKLAGVRLGGQLRLGNGWSLLGSAAYEERQYGGPEPIFLVERKDRQADASAGVSYLFRANTTILAQVAHTDNDSNVAINKFDRTVGTLSVRVNF